MSKPTVYTRSAIQLTLIALLMYFLFLVRTVLIYLVIALVLTLVLRPVQRLLGRIKIKSWSPGPSLTAFVSMLVFLAVVVGFNAFFIPLIIKDMKFFSQINYRQVFDVIERNFVETLAYLETMGIHPEFENENLKESILAVININRVGDAIERIVGSLGNIVVMLFSVTFMLFFLLREQNLGEKLAILVSPDNYVKNTRNILMPIKKTLTRYFLGLLLQITCVSLIVFTGLTIIGIKNAVLIAIFAGLINLIPYVGPLLGFSFGLMLGLGQAFADGLTDNLLWMALQIALVFMVVQLTDNSLLQPLIYSNSIRAHPLEIFLVISFAGFLGGIGAMIIAIPFYSVLRIFIWEFFPDLPLIKHLKKDG
jgi:predicted PurR-regulated permease PerM